MSNIQILKDFILAYADEIHGGHSTGLYHYATDNIQYEELDENEQWVPSTQHTCLWNNNKDLITLHSIIAFYYDRFANLQIEESEQEWLDTYIISDLDWVYNADGETIVGIVCHAQNI